jgi:hypothetical protein
MIRSSVPSFIVATLFGAASLLASAAAHADMCATDQRPGASLLIPFFEVDLAGTPGQARNTRFWVRNTATRPRLTNVTLWTTWGIPALQFNVFIPAYGTQRIDVGAIFLQGTLPQTGAGITPVGAFDSVGTPLTFATCNNGTTPGQPPIYTALSVGAQLELRARYSGTVTSNGQCYGANLGDTVARGFITVDDVNQCSNGLSPTDAGYFVSGGSGAATNDNVLLGGVEYVHLENNFAGAMPAYPVEAQSALLMPGDVSFYGRYVAYIAADDREPLPFSWSFDFDSGGTQDADDADLMVFRAAPRSFTRTCGLSQPWAPLALAENTPFDRAGNTPGVDPFPLGETQLPIGLATQLFPAESINNLLLDPLVNAGSGRINFTQVSGGGFPDGQSMLSVMHTWQGRFSETTPGRALDTGCTSGIVVPARVSGPLPENPAPPSYIFYDSFSS